MTGTSFIAPATDGLGNTISYAANAVAFDAPVITGLKALHIFGGTVGQSLVNLAPISSPANGAILGAGPAVSGDYVTTSNPNAFKLGVTDSSALTLFQAILMPTQPTSAATDVCLWSSGSSSSAGFTLRCTGPNVVLSSYTSSGTQGGLALPVASGTWALIMTTLDPTVPSAPVVTVSNLTSGATSPHTMANALVPSGSPIFIGQDATGNTSIDQGPLEIALLAVHNVVLGTSDINNSVTQFRQTLAARGITV
jgi:hypothetical protein